MSQNKSKLHHQHSIKSISGGSRKFSATLISSAVLSALVFMSGAHAASFGKLTVLSSLGQPLRAEIELTSVAKEEEWQLTAKLASPDVYKQAGIEFNASLMSLQFMIDERGTRKFVRVTSSQPINEPVVDVLMELGGTKTRVVREYTLMLDPAESRTPQSAQLAPATRGGQAAVKPVKAVKQAAAVVSSPSAPSVTAAASNSSESPAISTPIPAGARNDRSSAPFVPEKSEQVTKSTDTAKAAKTVVEKNAGPTSGKSAANYHVKKGDTLAGIASQNLSGSISLDQMLVAMYRSNKQAFVGNNMNRLRSGQVLSIPDAESVRDISKSEARGVILAQSKDFKNYRHALAGQVASSAVAKSAESKQSGGGKITAKVEEKVNSTDDAKDKLKLSRSGAANAPNAATEAKLAAANEDKIAHERAAAEAESKIKLLEKNVNDLQKVLEIKNKNLEDLEKQASAIKPVAPTVAVVAGTSPAMASAAPAVAVPAVSAPVTPGVATLPATPAADPAAATEASTPTVAVASTPAVVKPKAVPAPVQPAAPTGFFSGITDNPLLLPAAGVLALLLGGLGISRI
ncbi:MAG: LysM peptidoglycan-binding domain-containing protein, partial [Glaciimonas sp.]|nr:LysM peptidoglycan-binding domain-containing protein [Glaciimonas sp.]